MCKVCNELIGNVVWCHQESGDSLRAWCRVSSVIECDEVTAVAVTNWAPGKWLIAAGTYHWYFLWKNLRSEDCFHYSIAPSPSQDRSKCYSCVAQEDNPVEVIGLTQLCSRRWSGATQTKAIILACRSANLRFSSFPTYPLVSNFSSFHLARNPLWHTGYNVLIHKQEIKGTSFKEGPSSIKLPLQCHDILLIKKVTYWNILLENEIYMRKWILKCKMLKKLLYLNGIS